MVAFILSAGRAVVRRLVNDWLMLTVLTVTVLAAMVQLAAAPMYSDAVTVGAMRRILADAPPEDTTIVADARVAPTHYPELDDAITATAEDAADATGSDITRRLESASSYDLDVESLVGTGGGGGDDIPIVMSLSAPIGIANEASLVDGEWPGDAGDDSSLTAAISQPAADELQIGVGDSLRLNDRQSGGQFAVEIVGVYRVTDPTAAFWLDDDLLTAGVSTSRTSKTVGPLVVVPSALLGGSEVVQPRRLVATWLVEPRLDRLTVGAVDDLRRSLDRLPARFDRLTEELTPDAAETTSALDVTSFLPKLLLDTSRSLAVTRSGLYAVVAQLALLAAFALVIGANLLIDTRRRETGLLEARGISRRQLVAFAAIEALVLVVPVALISPWVAAALLRLVARFGPLATIDLAVNASVGAEALLTVVVAAVFVILLLMWPSIRATTSITNPLSHHRRQRVRQLTQSLGVDIALLALTAVAFWQLRAIRSTPIGRLADRFSVDPVLVVTPALGLLTGAVMTLRIVPLMARVGERLATAGRSMIGALTGWQLARRPGGQARAAFLLVMAVSIGFFAASYAATWERSQADQADFQIGADLRVLPNRRTNDSIVDLHLTATHEQLEQVSASMALQRVTGPLPGSDRRGTFLLLDAAMAPDIVSLRPDSTARFDELMAELAAARPEVPGLEVPGEPDRLEFAFDVTEELIETDDRRAHNLLDWFDDDPAFSIEGEFLPPAFSGQVDVVVRDGRGLLHRLAAGRLESNVGTQILSIDLVERPTSDVVLRPSYPLSIVDLQVRLTAPLFVARNVTVDLDGVAAVDSSGESTGVSLSLPGDASWSTTTLTQGRSIGAPATALTSTEDGISLDLETAASDPFSTAQILFGARPGSWTVPASFPVVVSNQWLSTSRTDVGEEINLTTIRLLDDTAVVAGAVDVVPTVDPATDHPVIADLPTLQVIDYALGRPIRSADEYWLAADGPAADTALDALSATLTGAPFESVQVEGRQGRFISLTTDPAALATIGAFTIGFVVAAVFAVLAFVAVTTVSARERRNEFSLLRAFGLGPRQFVGWMTVEQLIMVLVGVVLGAAIGFGLSTTVLPLISVGQQGTAAVPPADPRYPPIEIAIVVLTPLVTLAVTTIVSAFRRERGSLGGRLREGTT